MGEWIVKNEFVKVRDEGRTKVTNNPINLVGACGFEPQTPTVSIL